MARQYEELVHAVADRTLLDALLELGHGKLALAVLDVRNSWTASTKNKPPNPRWRTGSFHFISQGIHSGFG